MTQPTGYTRSEDFSQEETDRLAGRSTVSTAGLDAELDAIAVSINETITALGRIQRDDGELNDLTVDVYHLRASVLALMGSAGFTVHNPVGWLTATVYPARDMVTNGTGTYVSSVAHTSGVFATDLAAGKWALLFDSASFAASAVTFTPGGTIIATTVQAAILEAASEAMQKSANLSDVASLTTARSNLSVPSKAEIQGQTHTYFADSGSADALVVAPVPGLVAYATGQRLSVKKSSVANATVAPTLDAGLGAKTIFKNGGLPLLVGDLAASSHLDLDYDATYNGAAGGWEILNPALASGAGQGSSLVLISAAVAAASATIDFTSGISSTYDEYVIEVSQLIPATDNASLIVRISQAGVFKSGATDYLAVLSYEGSDASAGGSNSGAGTTGISASVQCGSNANFGGSGTIRFYGLASSAGYKRVLGNASSINSAQVLYNARFSGAYKTNANAIDGIRLLMSSGNITSGNFALYGVRKS